MTTPYLHSRTPAAIDFSHGDKREHSHSHGGAAAQFDDSVVGSVTMDRRRLANLRIENGTMANNGVGAEDPADDSFIYRPSELVSQMHRAPRGIRHTNKLASLLVEPSTGNNEYVGGLKLFVGLFIIAPFVIWIVLLLAVKLKYEYCHKITTIRNDGKKSSSKIPTPKTLISDDPNAKTPTSITHPMNASTIMIPITPWIAGGAVIDMTELSKAGVSRKERKKLVLRSWKIQSVFVSISILIPVFSVVLMERGWKPLEIAIQEIQELNEDVETLAYRGWNALDGLESSKEELFAENELVRSILEYTYASGNEPDRKPFKAGGKNYRRPNNNDDDDDDNDNDIDDIVDDDNDDSIHGNDRHRRAQFYKLGQKTTSPSLPATSDFDSHFYFEWSQMTTASPSEPVTMSKADNHNMNSLWQTEATVPPTVPQPQDSSIEKIKNNDNDNDSSISIFINSQKVHNKEGKNKTPTSPDGILNTSSPADTSEPSIPPRGIFIEDWCPDAIRFIGAEELSYWTDSINSLTEKTQTIHRIFNSLEISFPSMVSQSPPIKQAQSVWSDPSPIMHTSSAFQFVTDTTNYVDETIEWFFANDWLLKLLVLVLNVINGLLLANVYFFSKNNIIHQPTRLYVAYVLLPLFVLSAVFIVVVTVGAGVAVLINSDFCSGGSGNGGPQGTIEDAILTLQQQQQNNGAIPNDALNLVYDAVDYYWTGCLTENPLEFLEEFSDEIDDAAVRVNEFMMLLPIADSATTTHSVSSLPETMDQTGSTATDTSISSTPKTTLSQLNKACQRDMAFLVPAVHDLKRQVDTIRTNIHKLSDTISCGQVSPLLRRVSHGAVCVESPESLVILWGMSFGIGALCFILLTFRAALFNSVKHKKRRPTKPRRVVEKEFEEYKEFMCKHYGKTITNEWKIDGVPLPPTKLEFEFDKDIDLKGTFDTAKSTKGSCDDSQEEEDGSEKGGIFIRSVESDSSSYGSSYDSECSDDKNSIESGNGDEQSSVIGSFFSETKSIAMQTLHSLRNVKSMLSSSARANTIPFHIGNSDLHLGNRNVDEGDEKEIIGYENNFFFSRTLDDVSDLGGDDDNGDRTSNFDDDRSVANSISDHSLYLPTPKSKLDKNMAPTHAAVFEKKTLLTLSKDDDGFGDEDEINDAEDELLASHSLAMTKNSWTPTNVFSALSPVAPRKSLSFLARTLYTGKEHTENFVFDNDDYTAEELNTLVQPKQLMNLNSFSSNLLKDTSRQSKKTNTARSKQVVSRTDMTGKLWN